MRAVPCRLGQMIYTGSTSMGESVGPQLKSVVQEDLSHREKSAGDSTGFS